MFHLLRNWTSAAPQSSPSRHAAATREQGRTVDGLRQGTWRRFYDTGVPQEECRYSSGRLHGPVTRWYPTGTLQAEYDMLFGVHQGPFARFHPNGRLSEDGEWIDGRPHRAYCRWWPNGQKRMQGAFHHGRPVGEWCAWSETGHLVYCGCWSPALATALHGELRDQLDPGPQPAVSTVERLGWEGEYQNVA